MKTQEDYPAAEVVVKKDGKTTLILLPDYATEQMYCLLVFLYRNFSAVILSLFLYFLQPHPYLYLNFQKKFYPSMHCMG